ncbi:MAG: hypothetical protein GXO92_06085, partial [FCB group bacterium]|nr:hypothetical protein [FCB group bacterium]
MIRDWVKDAGCIYFMTNTVRFWLPVFCFKDAIYAVYSTWEYYRRSKNIRYYSYVIMPDHLHYIVWIPEGSFTLSDFQRDLKKFLSRTIKEILLSQSSEIHPFFH